MLKAQTIADDHPLIIEKVEVRLFRMPPSVPWEDATHRVPAIEIIILEMTVNGRLARGFSYTVGVGGTAVRALIHDYCVAELLGRDARYIVGLWRNLYHHLFRTGMAAITTLAMAAIDVALWEIRSLASGRPLYLELGGNAASIPAYTSGIDLHMKPAELARTQLEQQATGYQWFKVKVGLPNIADDIARVAAARKAIGPEAKLILDANQAWDLSEAIRRCNALSPYDITWIEEPLASNDVDGHATLRRKTSLPVAIGESLYTLEEFRQYLTADAVDVIQADVVRVGGLSPWLRIADLAAAWNRRVAPHFFAELSLHALCAIDNGLVLENVRGGSLFELGLAKSPVQITAGLATPLAAPGHGVEFDLERNAPVEVAMSGYEFSHVRSHKA